MDIASTNAIERVARVLAGHQLSKNADGGDAHAGGKVDAAWPDHRDEAVAVLKALREPDADMERAGDIAVWQGMIDAALGNGRAPAASTDDAPPAGTDPLHEGP